jgi:hypothetical protein
MTLCNDFVTYFEAVAPAYQLTACSLFFTSRPVPPVIIVFSGTAAQRVLWPSRIFPRGFLITHNDAPQTVGLLWTSDQLVAETSA